MVPSCRRRPSPNPSLLLVIAAILPHAAHGSGSSYLMRVELKQGLLSLGAVTSRGQFANAAEGARAAEFVSRLEAFVSDAGSPQSLAGAWDLVYCDVEPFRASPFWWTLAAALEDFRPGASARVLPAHRLATRVGEVGRVRQLISLDAGADDLGGRCRGTLTSEVDLRAGLVPGVPVGIRGTVVTSATFEADLQSSSSSGGGRTASSFPDAEAAGDAGSSFTEDDQLVLAASLQSTSVRESTLMVGYAGAGGETSTTDVALPLLDERALPVGRLLNTIGRPGGSPGGSSSSADGAISDGLDAGRGRTPRWRTTYMDDEMRVSRDSAEHFYVFLRARDAGAAGR